MESSAFKIGQRVMVVHKNNYSQIGSIKFIGTVKDVKGTWYGVELDTPTGKNDGKQKGVKYFTCKPGHGVFLKEHHFVLYTEGMEVLSWEEYEKQQATITTKRVPLTQQLKNKPTVKSTLPPKKDPKEVAKEDKLREKEKEKEKDKEKEKEKEKETEKEKEKEKEKDMGQKQESSSSTKELKLDQRPSKEDNVVQSELREQINKYLLEIKGKESKIYEIQQQNENLNQRVLNIQQKNQELEQKIKTMESQNQSEGKDNSKEIEELGKKLRMFMRKNQSLEEELKKALHTNNNQNLVEKLTMELQEKEQIIQENNQQLDVLANEQMEIYEVNSELEKQLSITKQQLEYLQQQQMQYDSVTDSCDEEQIREQNKKLKMAVQILNDNLQQEKETLQKRLQNYELALQCVPELQEKVKQMESLKKENQQKEQQIRELKDRLDDLGDPQNMIELMTREVIQKDSEIQDMQEKLSEMEKARELDQQFIAEYAKLNSILEYDIEQANVNQKIQANKFDEVVQKLTENNFLVEKYKDKMDQKNKENQELRLQLENNDKDQTFHKIEELRQKVQQQQLENGQIYSKYVAQQQQYLQVCQEIQVANVYLKKLPKELLEKLNINSFRQFLKVEAMVQKTYFVVKEVMEKYLVPGSSSSLNTGLQKWLITYLIYSLDIIYYSEIFVHFIQKALNNEKYQEILKRGQVFNQLASINVIIMNMVKYLQEESLSNKISLEPCKSFLSKLEESVMSLFRSQEFSVAGVVEVQVANYKRVLGKVGLLIQLYSLQESGIQQKQVADSVAKWTIRLRQYYFKSVQKSLLYKQCERHSLIQPIMDIDSQITCLQNLETFLEPQLHFEDRLKEKEVYDKLEGECQLSIVISDKEKEILDFLETEEYLYGENIAKGPWDDNIEAVYSELRKVIDQQQEFVELKEHQVVLVKQQQQAEQRQLEDQRIQQELQSRVAELQMKAERAVILEKDKDRMMEQQVMFKEHELQLKEALGKMEQELKEQQILVGELKERQQGLDLGERKGEEHEEVDGLGEGKYYKAICNKMIMQIYRLKAQQLHHKFTDQTLDQAFTQIQHFQNHKATVGSSGDTEQKQQKDEKDYFGLKKKRQEVRMLMASQKVVSLEQMEQGSIAEKAVELVTKQQNQFQDLRQQANALYSQFHSQISPHIKQHVKILAQEKNVLKLGSVGYNSKEASNVDLLIDSEQYSKMKNWLFNLQT